jgi:hypothetical protein
MPHAQTLKTHYPHWMNRLNNSMLIKSDDGSAFLIDCGMNKTYDELRKMAESSNQTRIEGIFITHYHDDHTNFVSELQSIFNCPVYVCKELADILKNPHAYRLPAMTDRPITRTIAVDEGHKMQWKEFTLTFYYFPGQTLYHDALLVESNNGETILFIGDSFSPTGMDDYCILNRNFIHSGMGYLYCLDFLENIPQGVWLVNQHIMEPFRFSTNQMDFMRGQLTRRRAILKELLPWEDPNYGIDEQWARIYPYGQKVKSGTSAQLRIIIMNHDDHQNDYEITPNHDLVGISIHPQKRTMTVQPRSEAEVNFSIDVSHSAEPGIHVLTADIGFNNWNLRQWCECIIHVSD